MGPNNQIITVRYNNAIFNRDQIVLQMFENAQVFSENYFLIHSA